MRGWPATSSDGPRRLQSVCHSAGIDGQAGTDAPIIGSEGLLRLVELAGRLRACGLSEGGASWMARTGTSSPDGGTDERSGVMDVVPGTESVRRAEAVEHAPGTLGGPGRTGGRDRG